MQTALLIIGLLLTASVAPYFIEPLRRRLYTPFPGLVAIRFPVRGELVVERSRIVRLTLDLNVFVTVILMFMGYTFLLQAVVPSAQRSVAFVPLIPGLTIPFSLLINLIWIIAVAIVIHELFHYLACVWQGVPVKSAGVGLMFFFPIAFVEPDEEVLLSTSSSVRARIYSAGPSANALLGALAILLTFLLISKGIYVVKVDPGTPAWKAGIRPGDVIVYVNGVKVNDLGTLRSLIESSRVLRVTVLRGNEELTLTVFRDNHKLIGIYVLPWAPKGLLRDFSPDFTVALVQSLFWTQGINMGLAVVNALPMIITDGGKLVAELKRYRKLAWASDFLQIFTIVVFVQALLGSITALR